MQYTKQNQRRVLTHSPYFLERKHHKNVDFMGETAVFTEKRIAQGHLKQ